MEKREHYFSGSKWEPIVGYSRGIRTGSVIEIAGTCSIDAEGKPFGANDAYKQTQRILEIITAAIDQLGGSINDVVRTRIFVSDIDHWEEIGKAHGETFHSIRPVTTMVEVSRLIAPEFMVEIEATAIVRDN